MHRPQSRGLSIAAVWVLAVALAISLGANLLQSTTTSASATSMSVAQSSYPVVWGFSNMARNALRGAPVGVSSTQSDAATVAWSQATGALEAAAPALRQLGVVDVGTVVQEYQLAYDSLPTSGDQVHPKLFADARRFISLAASVLPELRTLGEGQSIHTLSAAFQTLAQQGAFILPSP